jgi:chromosome partitioning protein
MPKTIAIAARKGGPGKTTIAVNLAAAAGDSTIVDIDPQNSAGIWGDRPTAQSILARNRRRMNLPSFR